ncbi:TolC family protein [Poseidonibacter lekithochrous]|uniref:TolC family protein n=1 Tax=Poseidonibacter TaxID=2321187 RepID=UPI001C0A3D60|nr:MULTISPECIES: TolC family protein [Poseidonibacter]MBU3015395.1 TolC family protein [Poseidonibacter lekithochrous]MDO6828694.1 TolC family protein [Poseidonibacter sp. 1_MG-2023]
MKNIKRKLILSMLAASILTVNINALTLPEAVDIALENNHEVQAKNFDYLESLENVKLNDADFLPKVGLGFVYNNRDEIAYPTQVDTDATFSAEVSYNLFNGFKNISDRNSSKFLSQSSQYSLNALKQDIILNTKIAYINYLDKENALETFKSAYNLFQEQYIDSKNRYEQGLIAKNDLLQVQVNMSSAKQNVAKAKGDLKTAKNTLSNILGGMDLSSESIEKLSNTTLKTSDYDMKLLDNRSEIQALNMNLEAIKQQKKSIKSSFYPKVDASISHNEYYEDISDYKNQNIASLSASWNLYNGGFDNTKGNIYRTRYLKAKTQLDKTKLDIKLQYENAISNLEVAIENFNTASLSQEQAEENYQIVKNRFDEGISTSTDLTDANYLLTQSKQGLNRAYFDKFLAVSTLDRIFEK